MGRVGNDSYIQKKVDLLRQLPCIFVV